MTSWRPKVCHAKTFHDVMMSKAYHDVKKFIKNTSGRQKVRPDVKIFVMM